MDEAILTPRQRVTVAGLRVLNSIDPSIEVVKCVTVEDVKRRTLNAEFADNGIDGVRLVESQANQ